MSQETAQVEYANVRLDPKFFLATVGGRTFPKALIEIFKNSVDAGATLFSVITNDKAGTISFADNGYGMNKSRRDAYCSYHCSTGEGDSARFGTGSKNILAFGSVDVVTVSKDNLKYLYTFTLNNSTFGETLLDPSGNLIEIKPVLKTKNNWRFSSETGTVITLRLDEEYQGKNPPWGKNLPELISAIIPLSFHSMVTVNGKPLPPKNVIGEIYSAESVTTDGKTIIEFQLYQPKKRVDGDGLFITSTIAPEIPIGHLCDLIGEDLERQIPIIYKNRRVCGIIRVPAIAKYTLENRFTLNARIKNDPLVIHIIQALKEHEELVQEALKIQGRVTQDDRGLINEIVEVARDLFGSPVESRPVEEPDLFGKIDNSNTIKTGTPNYGGSNLKLTPDQVEYEVGEVCKITVTKNKEFIPGSRLKWNLPKSINRLQISNPLQISFKEPGVFEIEVSEKGSILSKRVRITVIEKRLPRLNHEKLLVSDGETVVLTLVNGDKLIGKPVWEYSGNGQLIEDQTGLFAHFTAKNLGTVKIFLTDTKNRAVNSTCEIQVIPAPQKTPEIKIGDQTYQVSLFPSGDATFCPVYINPGKHTHMLCIETKGLGYQENRTNGTIRDYLIGLICQAVATFEVERLRLHSGKDIGVSDTSQIIANRHAELLTLFNTKSLLRT